jgi:hypothetical protein
MYFPKSDVKLDEWEKWSGYSTFGRYVDQPLCLRLRLGHQLPRASSLFAANLAYGPIPSPDQL